MIEWYLGDHKVVRVSSSNFEEKGNHNKLLENLEYIHLSYISVYIDENYLAW